MSMDSVAPSTVVKRWRRYGRDRAYVAFDGLDLGYRDLKTGLIECDRPADIPTVARATEALQREVTAALRAESYRPRHAAVVETAETAEPPVAAALPVRYERRRSTPVALEPEADLADNRPGESIREHARDLRDAAPVRSFFLRLVDAKTDERAYRVGADGEQIVARRLERLGEGWHVLHSVPVGTNHSDIDHVVIGPGGVFTLNTKHHRDASVWVAGNNVKVNNTDQPYVHKSRSEADRAAKLLWAVAGERVPVNGIVVVVGAQRGFTVRQQPGDVRVVRHGDLVRHLRAMPPQLEPDAVERLYEAARHRSTWQPKLVARGDLS